MGLPGVPFTQYPSPLAVTSNGGIAASVSQPGNAFFGRRDQLTTWGGNFAPGDALIWNGNNSGTITIVFSTPVAGAGAQVQRAALGPFTATLTVFDANDHELATVSREGNSPPMIENNTAIFLGVLSDLPDISRITFGVADGFAMNQLDLTTSAAPTPAPEPGTLFLLATALAGAVAAGRRGRS